MGERGHNLRFIIPLKTTIPPGSAAPRVTVLHSAPYWDHEPQSNAPSRSQVRTKPAAT